MSTLNQQVWTNQLMKHFYPEASFLSYARDFSQYSKFDMINIADAGFDPEVLVNNTTYPIKIAERKDENLSFELDLFETENTLVRYPTEVEISYDKLESVLYSHRMVLQTTTAKKAAHAFAPNSDSEYTPVIGTSGDDDGEGQKRILLTDILKLKRRFDMLDVPADKRYLVLDPRHTEDLIISDLKAFKDITDFVNGKPKRFAGFNVLEYTKNPVFKVNQDKVNCLNCSSEEIDDSLSVKIETGDTAASIYYDENGVLVKKVVNTEKTGVVTKKEEYIIAADEVEKKVYKEIKEQKNR